MLTHQGVALFEKIRKCGLVGRSLSLAEGFVASKAYAKLSVSLFQLPGDLDVKLSSASPATCVPACLHAPSCDDNGVNLRNCRQASLKCVPLQDVPLPWCLFTALEHRLK